MKHRYYRQLEVTPHPEHFKELGGCAHWTYRVDWLDAMNASIVELNSPSPEYFGELIQLEYHSVERIYCSFSGRPSAASLEGPATDVPLLFLEKNVFAVTIPNAFIDGDEVLSLPFSYCEVYAPTSVITNVCEFTTSVSRTALIYSVKVGATFRGGMMPIADVTEDIISLVLPNLHNFHHVLVEFVVKFASLYSFR